MTTPSLSITTGGPGGPMSPNSPCKENRFTPRSDGWWRGGCLSGDRLYYGANVCSHSLSNHHSLSCWRIHFVLLFIIICCPDLHVRWNWWLLQIRWLLLSSYPLKVSNYLNRKHRHLYTMCTGDQLCQHTDQYQVDNICSLVRAISFLKAFITAAIYCLGILNFNNRSLQKNGFLHKTIQVEQASCDKLQQHSFLSLTLSKSIRSSLKKASAKFGSCPNCHHIYHINTMQWAKAVHTLLLLPVILLCT